jgi:polar amino acid transport system permease protein
LVPIIDLIPPLLRGAVVTIQLTVASAAIAFILSFLIGFSRMSKYTIIRALATIYVEIIRGTSLLVQLFWVFFALPFFGIHLSPMIAGIATLALNYGAYGSEVVRSSISAIPNGQTEAGVALNMSPWQRMRIVILPQALLLMLPSFGNLMIELIKGTALVSLITLSDLTFQGMTMRTTTLQTTEIFTLLLIMYFLIAYPFTLGIRWLEKKLSIGRL